jgi:hypothetical protein
MVFLRGVIVCIALDKANENTIQNLNIYVIRQKIKVR